MRYFLGRVSTKDQSLARQLRVARERFDIPDENVFCDKASGKSFDRPEYQRLKETVQPGDEVIVKEFDRFGRNQKEAKKELEWFKEHKVIVRILDIPTTLMEYPEGSEWVLDMVTNVLIEVLGAVAEQERNKIRQRSAEGMAAMPVVDGRKVSARTGHGFGRPKVEVDRAELDELLEKQRSGRATVKECCERLGIGRTTWYALVGKEAV